MASAVGVMCIEIFGCRDAGARDYAMNLGLALQLTNIMRDVKVDLEHGRVYLPQDDLRRFGCTEDDLAAGRVTPDPALLQHQLPRPGVLRRRRGDADGRGAAPRGRRDHGRHLLRHPAANRARGYDVFREVIRVPRPERAWIAAATWTKTLLRAGVEALSPARTP